MRGAEIVIDSGPLSVFAEAGWLGMLRSTTYAPNSTEDGRSAAPRRTSAAAMAPRHPRGSA